MKVKIHTETMTDAQYEYLVKLQSQLGWNWQRCFDWIAKQYGIKYNDSSNVPIGFASALINYMKELV